jgi:hypothetical protein
MSDLLTPIPEPRHRQAFPGEIVLSIMGQKNDRRGEGWTPATAAISVTNWDASEPSTVMPGAGSWRVLAQHGHPGVIDTAGLTSFSARAADLGALLGDQALAGSLSVSLDLLIARFHHNPPANGLASWMFRVNHPVRYVTAMLTLTHHCFPDVPPTQVLAGLEDAWSNEDYGYGAHMDWYRGHGPSGSGETQDDYDQEVAVFQATYALYNQSLPVRS